MTKGLESAREDRRLWLSPERGGSPGKSGEQARQVAGPELGAPWRPQRSWPGSAPLSGCPAPRGARVPPRSPHKARTTPETPDPHPQTPSQCSLPAAAPLVPGPRRPHSEHHAGNFSLRRCRRRRRRRRSSCPSSRSAAAAGIFLTRPLQLPLVTADCEPNT